VSPGVALDHGLAGDRDDLRQGRRRYGGQPQRPARGQPGADPAPAVRGEFGDLRPRHPARADGGPDRDPVPVDVGAGSIGEGIADRLRPFEVSLTLVARRPREGVHGVAELPVLLPEADIVVLTVPLTDSTIGLVDGDVLAAMPDGSLLVNAARGRVVDSHALTVELAKGRIGAALDVTEPEPLPPGDPLWQLPNVLLTPHVAASVGGVLVRAYALVGDQVRRYAAGEPLANVVTEGY
jgi:hypothetical protein